LPSGGGAAALPSFFLLVGGVELLLIAGVDLRSAFGAIVLHDVRGRRRWVAAESELDRVRTAYRGQSHDVTSLLSAVDGTLLVLGSQAVSLSEERSRQLLQSIRGQIQRLTAILTEDRDQPVEYDLAELLSEAVALHAAGARPPRLRAELGLVLTGHPDRVLRLVNNLLVNAERHAPGAPVLVSARRSGEQHVELAVADGGSGLTPEQLARALEPGWRATASATVPGSGLGLAQCRELALAEGGAIRLGPTQELTATGHRGLTVRIRLPLAARHVDATNSPILQMPGAQPGGINKGVAPDQIRSTPIHGTGQ
ncbi:MAG: HAMP domain-containing sensor histidine kinase, partial [Candidatus Dormiibacterota bacterium]